MAITNHGKDDLVYPVKFFLDKWLISGIIKVKNERRIEP
jgi:hypothetical protein